MSAPIQTIGGRRFSFGKMSATNAVRVHVALLRVLGEPLFKLLVLGEKKPAKPAALTNEHGEPGTAPPALPGMPAAPAENEAAAPAGVEMLGVSLTGDDIAVIAGAFGVMAKNMTDDEMLRLLGLVLGSAYCETKAITDIDVTFGDGKSLEMYRVFWEALKVNFSGFFPANLIASLRAAKAP